MGMIFVDIEVASIENPEGGETVRFLVDSGVTYSVVPSEVLSRLGVRPLTEQVFNLANGDQIRRRKGGAVFKFRDRIGTADVIFGKDGDSNLLGAFTLEALGLALDPLRRELRQVPMMLANLTPGSEGDKG